MALIDQILLEKTQAPIVIFVEEVDSLLSLAFDNDGFFRCIRTLHERRAERPVYKPPQLLFPWGGHGLPSDPQNEWQLLQRGPPVGDGGHVSRTGIAPQR